MRTAALACWQSSPYVRRTLTIGDPILLDLLNAAELASLASVILIDVVMSGDNAVIIGLAAAGLPADMRRKVIVFGILGATVLRIAFASITVQLLEIIGLTLAGGILLLWVAWRMWRELRAQSPAAAEVTASAAGGGNAAVDGADHAHAGHKTFRQAFVSIIVADLSMSLDNVLAVAGAAQGHTYILAIGLGLSIVLMGIAANFIARLLERYHWIAYVGLAVVAYVALDMIYRGSMEVMAATHLMP